MSDPAGRSRAAWHAWSMLRYTAAAALFAPLALLVKHHWLINRGYQRIGLDRGLPGTRPPLADQLALYRGDLLVSALLLPLAVALVCRALPRWARPALAGAVGLAGAAILCLQWEALNTVGSLLPASQFASAMHFRLEQPDIAAAYLTSARTTLLWLAVVTVLALTALWWAWRHDRPGMAGPVPADRWQAMTMGLVAILAAAAWSVPAAPTVYHDSMLVEAVAALTVREDDTPPDASATSLMTSFGRLTRTPAARPLEYTGSARGYDVVLFVMETIPQRCVRFDGDLTDLPTIAALRTRAFVPRRHYTTQPWSSYALFSLFSSWYPPVTPQSPLFNPLWSSGALPTGLQALKRASYQTRMFAPYRTSGEPDEQMFGALGFDSTSYPGDAAGGASRDALRADTLALVQLLETVAALRAQRVPFVAGFVPQISHGPWRDLDPAHPAASLLARCRRLVALQDRWLARIVAQLPDRVLIVVTSDHGIRTHAEDPSYRGGRLDEYAFHVPLLLYAPGVLHRPVYADGVTSHVDVMPTVLDLLGVDGTGIAQEGVPIYEPALADRMTLYIARYRQGVDGYHQGHRFVQWAPIEHTVAAATDSLFFGGEREPMTAAMADDRAQLLRRVLAVHKGFLARTFADHAGQ